MEFSNEEMNAALVVLNNIGVTIDTGRSGAFLSIDKAMDIQAALTRREQQIHEVRAIIRSLSICDDPSCVEPSHSRIHRFLLTTQDLKQETKG